ncbi:MAG: hypothetical protein J0M12_12930 [Deltaproteobacteria bacterium]|nr:hypothetical protein [Deltaproteobacteria bacterium]
MSLASLLGECLDTWALGVVAALYLHEIEPAAGMFEPLQGARIRDCWEQLQTLPKAWATELCLEALGEEHD